MYYNVYLFLIVLTIISPVAAYNRNEILKKVGLNEEVTEFSDNRY